MRPLILGVCRGAAVRCATREAAQAAYDYALLVPGGVEVVSG